MVCEEAQPPMSQAIKSLCRACNQTFTSVKALTFIG